MILLNKTLRLVTFLIAILLLISWQGDVFAQVAPVAQVVWVKGSVKAIRDNNMSRELKRRAPIYVRDTIVTGPGSEGQIVFTDQSTVALRVESALRISDYQGRSSSVSPSSERYVLDLAKGGLRTISGVIAKDNPDGYKVNTPVATIGVRGTGYSVVCKSPDNNPAHSQCATGVFSGSIIVSNAAGSIVIGAGTATPYAEIKSASDAPQATSQPPSILTAGGGGPELLPAQFQSGAGGARGSVSAVCVGGG